MLLGPAAPLPGSIFTVVGPTIGGAQFALVDVGMLLATLIFLIDPSSCSQPPQCLHSSFVSPVRCSTDTRPLFVVDTWGAPPVTAEGSG